MLESIGYYLVFQSVFLLGSVWWKKLALVKTVLMLQLVAVGVALVAAVTLRIVFRKYFHGIEIDFNDVPGFERLVTLTSAGAGPLVAIGSVVRIVVLSATAPVCWLIGWLRLREIEV